jgi:hypothetical protein
MDPIGWGFERYDPLGNHRETDVSGPIDSQGVLENLKDGTKQPFDGAVELARLLVASPQVHECMTRQWLRYGLGRRDVPADARSIGDVVGIFAKKGRNMRELMIALAGSPSFVTRSPSPGEVLR